MRAVSLIALFTLVCVLRAQTDSAIIPSRISDSVALAFLDSMMIVADTANSLYQVQIMQPSVGSAPDEPTNALYIALTRLGQRVDREVYRIRTIAAPSVERIELGQLAFKMTVAYDVDFGNRKLSATVKLDRLLDKAD